MYLECSCVDTPVSKIRSLMKGARKCSYKRLIAKIKREIPTLYKELALDFPNPWDEECKQTNTHYILVHSAIEYFINKGDI